MTRVVIQLKTTPEKGFETPKTHLSYFTPSINKNRVPFSPLELQSRPATHPIFINPNTYHLSIFLCEIIKKPKAKIQIIMCRTTDFNMFLQEDKLKVKAFFIRFSGLKSTKNLPDSLSLLFLDGSAAVLKLHRVANVKTKKGEVIFGSREVFREEAVGVARFEVLLKDERILKGLMFREEEKWKLECECLKVGGAADVAVAVDGEMAVLSGRVEMVGKRRKRFGRLEVIPEEVEDDDEMDKSYGLYNCEDLDLEGVKWAVDLGIWVMCFGVGYLVSKASARSLRRMRLF